MPISATVIPRLGKVYLPQSKPDQQTHPLHVANFPYADLMGPWHVVASSLPLWKRRKDICIAYEPICLPGDASSTSESPTSDLRAVSFADECRWQEDADPPGEDDDQSFARPDPDGTPAITKNWIRGVNKLAPNAPNGTCMAWRGKGLLMPLTASWEIIGLSSSFTSKAHGAEKSADDEECPTWLVTYFGASLFTPSGIDIYCREPHELKPEQYYAIRTALQSLCHFDGLDVRQRQLADEIYRRASDLYRIPHSKP